jgi:hypothetical protein
MRRPSPLTLRGLVTSLASLASLALVAAPSVGCGAKPVVAPKPTLPALETDGLATITQGPGARWVALAKPKELFEGPLAGPLTKLVPREGLDRLGVLLGFDLRKSPDALLVQFAETTYYAAHLPAGASPQLAIEAFERRVLQPSGRSATRPDVVRAWGSLPSGDRASAAALWSPRGDAITGESGRFGPVNVAIALASGQLAKGRSLALQPPYASLLAWSAGAPMAVLARCPLSDQIPKSATADAPAITEECDGAGLAARALPGGRLELRAHVEGRWGKDAPLIEQEARGVITRLVAGEIGRALGLGDAKFEYASSPTAIDVRLEVDAESFAERLRKLVSAELPEVMK